VAEREDDASHPRPLGVSIVIRESVSHEHSQASQAPPDIPKPAHVVPRIDGSRGTRADELADKIETLVRDGARAVACGDSAKIRRPSYAS